MNGAAIKICFVLPTLALGGTERQLLQLTRRLSHDFDIRFVCTRHAGPLAGEARRQGTVHLANTWGGWDFRIGRRVHRIFRLHKPDIMHSFMFGFDAAVNVAARKAGVPVVVSSRREIAQWKNPRHIRLQRLANELVDCVVANSRAVADFAIAQEGGDPGLYEVIHNGVDADSFCSTVDDDIIRRRYDLPFHTKVVGIVANFSPVKDHALFIDTAVLLAKRRPEVHFLMVGSGALKARLQRTVARRGLTGRVTFLSEYPELANVYRVMAVSVLCSKAEGFPNALMESMAAGTPVVAAAVGGIPELVEDGKLGTLVSSRDPADFANAIEWVLENGEEAKSMAAAAAEHVRANLRVDAMADAYVRLYERLLTKAGGKG